MSRKKAKMKPRTIAIRNIARHYPVETVCSEATVRVVTQLIRSPPAINEYCVGEYRNHKGKTK